MIKQIIECVPNFSEGRDLKIIEQITDIIKSVEGVKVVGVDPGATTNRTVVTMIGSPDDVCEAAFRAVKKAAELIDMSKQKGTHPRFGATDVCPLVPVANISMDETKEYARKLAKRIGKEAGVPVYCYEEAAYKEERKNLANCRFGEYEAIKNRIETVEWKPDFGPAKFTENVAKSGVTAVGARKFLIAINYNLNTTSTRCANAVAFDVREKGRIKREGNKLSGKIIYNKSGEKEWTAGALKATKAIGWFIDEFGIAQVSMNMTDLNITSIHKAYDTVCEKAEKRGMRVTGAEIVGLVPLKALLDAGKYYLTKQKRSVGIPEKEIVKIAIKSMGLDDLYPFEPEKKVIEYMIKDSTNMQLIDMNLTEFSDETASESPAPGGGSISAYMGAMGVSLGAMVANLSSHKRGWDSKWKEFSDWAEKAMSYQKELLKMVDEDTNAFNKIMDAFSLPKKTEKEKIIRKQTIQNATKYAIQVPFKTMELCYNSMEIMKVMAEIGNPNSVTDAGVGALAARSGVIGAFMNVKINTGDIEDKFFVKNIIEKGQEIVDKTVKLEAKIIEIVNGKI